MSTNNADEFVERTGQNRGYTLEMHRIMAEVDLELRGPGDFFGTRQSGLPALRMAHLSDRRLLEMAREEAALLMEVDPELKAPEHAALAAQVARFVDQASADVA